jgi:hypothetical protein
MMILKSGCSQPLEDRRAAKADLENATTTAMISFQTTDWSAIPVTEHSGETGTAFWRTLQLGDLRIRMVEYSENYMADHWCSKGHIIYCIEGEMTTELRDGKKYVLSEGMTYQVSDDASEHRSMTTKGVKLLIIDGSFLGNDKDDAVPQSQK